MGFIKKIIKKIKSEYFVHLSPNAKAEFMRGKCRYIGKNVKIFTTSLGTEPYLVSIYDNVNIASGVHFVSHDISIFNVSRYLKMPEGLYLDKVGTITLHENCCVGAYSTLMPNCSVGKNSIIAACSVVVGNIPENEVWGGYRPNLL